MEKTYMDLKDFEEMMEAVKDESERMGYQEFIELQTLHHIFREYFTHKKPEVSKVEDDN